MLTSLSAMGRTLPVAGKAGFVSLAFAGALFVNTPGHAQQPAQQAPAAPPAAAAQGGGAQESSWVKLCQQQKAKDKQVNVCLTHHERLHPNTGLPLISAAIREIEGEPQKIMMFMVPLGRLLAPGLIMQVDDKEPLKIGYNYCTSIGCVAQAPVSAEIIDSFKKGGTLTIRTIDVGQKKVGFQVSLAGFTRALDGPSIDPKAYAQARKEMFEMIRARQVELAKKAAEAAKSKGAPQGGAQQGGQPQQQAPAQAPRRLQ